MRARWKARRCAAGRAAVLAAESKQLSRRLRECEVQLSVAQKRTIEVESTMLRDSGKVEAVELEMARA